MLLHMTPHSVSFNFMRLLRTQIGALPRGPPETEPLAIVRVQYSTINYKDGMVLGGLPGVASGFPLVPGIDFAGSIIDGAGVFETV